MFPNLKTAILEFIANEYKLDPETIGEDLNFQTDLNLTPDEFTSLLQRLQDSLDFTLPEDKVVQIVTLEDLFGVLGLDTESDPVIA